jgi:hypothetical protein
MDFFNFSHVSYLGSISNKVRSYANLIFNFLLLLFIIIDYLCLQD